MGRAYRVPEVGTVFQGSLHGFDGLLVGKLAGHGKIWEVLDAGYAGALPWWTSDSLIMPNPIGPTGFPAMVFGILAGAIVEETRF